MTERLAPLYTSAVSRQPRRYVFLDFTELELKVIELRTSGIRPGEIGLKLGLTRAAVYKVIMAAYRKSGTSNTAQLTRWAWEMGLDVPAPSDTPETAAVIEPKVRKNIPIKLGRIRRAKLVR